MTAAETEAATGCSGRATAAAAAPAPAPDLVDAPPFRLPTLPPSPLNLSPFFQRKMWQVNFVHFSFLSPKYLKIINYSMNAIDYQQVSPVNRAYRGI